MVLEVSRGGSSPPRGTQSGRISPERHMLTPSLISADATIISERQLQWDRQAQSADQKQAELFHIQWNLIRDQMNTFSRELIAIRSELKPLKSMEVRLTDVELKLSQMLDFSSSFDEEARLRREADDALAAQLRTVSESLASEARARASELEEVSRQLGQVRHGLEKEAREQRVSRDEIAQKLQDLTGAADQERSDREYAISTLRSQIAGWRQDVEAEHVEHVEHVTALRRAVQALEGQLGPGMKELWAGLEKESRVRAEEISKVSSALSRDLGSLGDELRRNEAQFRTELEAEMRARLADKESLERRLAALAGEELLARLGALSGALDQEVRDRQLGQTEGMDRWQDLTKALEQERADRERGASTLRGQLGDFRQELRTERSERIAETAEVGRGLQSLESSTVPVLKELRAAIEAEASERKEFDSWLDKSGKEVRARLEAEVGKREHFAEEVIASLADTRRSVENEVLVRTEEHARVALNLSHLQGQLETETRERSHGASDLSERLRALSDALGMEAGERRDGDAELERGLRTISAAIEHETRQRIQELTSFQDATRLEGVERTAGDVAIAKDLRTAEQRLEAMVESLRDALWSKMVTLMDRFMACGREWRDTPPTIGHLPHPPPGGSGGSAGTLVTRVLKDASRPTSPSRVAISISTNGSNSPPPVASHR